MPELEKRGLSALYPHRTFYLEIEAPVTQTRQVSTQVASNGRVCTLVRVSFKYQNKTTNQIFGRQMDCKYRLPISLVLRNGGVGVVADQGKPRKKEEKKHNSAAETKKKRTQNAGA